MMRYKSLITALQCSGLLGFVTLLISEVELQGWQNGEKERCNFSAIAVIMSSGSSESSDHT